MPYDYTDAPPREKIALIPTGTTATFVLHINAGGVGEDGMLTRSKEGTCEMLVCELTIPDGPYKGRKIFERWILEGTRDGHAKAGEISRRTLKAIIDSAFGLKPDDVSPEARKARTLSLGQFEGVTFVGRVGVEKGNDTYPDKNILAGVITPDKKEWHPSEQPPPFNGGGSGAAASATPATPAPPIERPGWAS